MNYWVFNLNGFAFPLKEGVDADVTFETGYNFRGEAQDSVLILGYTNGLRFLFKGEISAEPVVTPVDLLGVKRRYKVTLKITKVTALTEPNLLSDYAYTLSRVKKLTKPEKHFSRAYTRISSKDYHAITNGEIFIARTFFGKVVNALHPGHRVAFVKRILDEDPLLYAQGRNYIKAFDMLKEYILETIIEPAQMINDAHRMIIDISPKTKIARISFADPVEPNVRSRLNNVSEKAAEVSRFLDSNGVKFLEQVSEEIKIGTESEKTLNYSFTNQPLPIIF